MIRVFPILLFIVLFSCSNNHISENQPSPCLHFAAEKNWTGEPTGLVYYKGKYHIYFQYNQAEAYFGNISWGHAVSNDLIHWNEQPIAIPYDSLNHTGSGSVIVDFNNSSKLSLTDTMPFIAFSVKKAYINKTIEKREIHISYSLDGGFTWQKYPKPILQFNEAIQNPKVKWNKKLNKWLMTLSNIDAILFYTSTDCKNWTYFSEFKNDQTHGGIWESSDFFSLTDPKTKKEKWILLISQEQSPLGDFPITRYFIGNFDNTGFHPTQNNFLLVDYGRDHYADMTFNNVNEERTILMSWMNCWNYANLLPRVGKFGFWAIPKEISLTSENNGKYILATKPIKELDNYWNEYVDIDRIEILDTYSLMKNFKIKLPCELTLKFDVSSRSSLTSASLYGIRFITGSGKKLEIGYNAEAAYFYINPSDLLKLDIASFGEPIGAAYILRENHIDWKIFLDHNSIEFGAVDGKVSLSSLFYNDSSSFVRVELFTQKGKTILEGGSLKY